MRFKYKTYPDFVRGGGFISSVKLVELFGVRREEVLFPEKDLREPSIGGLGNLLVFRGIGSYRFQSLITLRPQEDGDYSLERAKTQFVRCLFTGNPI